MKKSFAKRILSAILCLSMLVCSTVVCSFEIYADNNEARIGQREYATLADAVNAASNGDTITLISDVTVSSTISVSKALTITADRGTRVIRRSSSLSAPVFEVTGNLSVIGGDGNIRLDGAGVSASSAFVKIAGGSFNMRDGVTLTSNVNTSGKASGVEVAGGVFNFSGGSITDNTSNGYGNAVYLTDNSGTLRMSGGASFGSGANVYLPSSAYIEINGNLNGSGEIAVYSDSVYTGTRIAAILGNFTLSKSQLDRFTVSDGMTSYNVTVSGSDINAAEPKQGANAARIGDTVYTTLEEAVNAVSNGKSETVYLISNTTISSPVTVGEGKSITLSSDGNYTVSRSVSYLNGELFKVESGASLSIGAQGKAITLSGSGAAASSPLITVAGSLSIGADVSITNARNNVSDSARQGIVNINGGSFNMTGGVISSNNTLNGTVHINSGSFTMSGGEIKHNASQNGGAVYIESGSFNMSGGSLYGNSATNGGSVWNAGSFNISGSASILSNPSYPQSVYLAKSAAINVDSGWTCPEVSGYTSAIQIDSEVKTFGTVIVKFSSGIVHKEKFVLVPAMSSQLALIAKDNTLVLAGADEAYTCYIGSVGYQSIAEAIEAINTSESVTIQIVNDTIIDSSVIIPNGKNIVLTAAVNPANSQDFTERRIKRSENYTDAMFAVEEGASLTITSPEGKSLIFDGEGRSASRAVIVTSGILSLGMGTVITGNPNNAAQQINGNNSVYTFGGGVYVEQTGTCSLSDNAKITGCYASYGGGVYVKDGALNLIGGEISANEAMFGAGAYLESSDSIDSQSASDNVIRARCNMTGGSFSSNKASQNKDVSGSGSGGAVYIGNSSYFEMTGGSISSNTASKGAGVCVGRETTGANENKGEPTFIMSGNASIASNDGVYLAMFNVSYIKVTSPLTSQSKLEITIPSHMPQNMTLVRYTVSDNEKDNENACRAAFNKGIFTLDNAASQYFILSVSDGDKAVIVNSTEEGSFGRYNSGRHYNGLDRYLEGDDESDKDDKEDSSEIVKTPISYEPITILPNSVFTSYFEMTYYPNLYKNMNIAITAPFPAGTRIAMIDTSDDEKIGYYYYEVTGNETVISQGQSVKPKNEGDITLNTPDVIEIPLTSFYKMGTIDTFYEHASPKADNPSDPKAKITDRMLFIVDFTDAKSGEGETLEGSFMMSWNHYYPGSYEGERYDISANLNQSEYTVQEKIESQLNLEITDNNFNISYLLSENAQSVVFNSGVILLELTNGNFAQGSILTDSDGNQYLVRQRSNVIAVPLPRDDNGDILLTGAISLELSNYYGTAMLNSSVRALIAASNDGEHLAQGEGYDAESEDAEFTLKANDEYSVLVTTTDNKKKPYYENYDAVKNEKALTMNVSGLYNSTETSTFNFALLKKNGEDYEPCMLSELFDVGDEMNYEVIIDTGTVNFALTSDLESLRGNEYKLQFTVGNAVEYVKVNFTDK